MLFSILVISSCGKDLNKITVDYDASKVISQDLAEQIAKRVTTKFLLEGKESRHNILPIGIPDRAIQNQIVIPDKFNIPALYVFNYVNDGGFVVISADERHEPICAIIESGNFESDTVPSMLISWFEATVENIEMVRYESYDNTNRAKSLWFELFITTQLLGYIENMDPKPFDGEPIRVVGDDCCPECPNYPDCLYDIGLGCGAEDICPPNPDPCGTYSSHIVGPFLPCEWGQGCSYNEECDDKDCTNVCWSNENAWTGCVATAMSQIMRYWSIANQFNYNYSSMPNNQGNSEVQRMMHDVGVKTGMKYNCNGSFTTMEKAEASLTSDFGFSTASLSPFQSTILISDLDNLQPVILKGCNNRTDRFLGLFYTYSVCHAWVCDGYWRSWNNCYGHLQLHMNWGWNENFSRNNFNGWYLFNNWTPSQWNFQYAQEFIHNIKP